jgi:hypothetical protein
MPCIARIETVRVGNHTVTMNIPNFPQYAISHAITGDSKESILIQFNESILKTALVGPTNFEITIYNDVFPENTTEIRSWVTKWGDENYPGDYSIFQIDMLGGTGIVLQHSGYGIRESDTVTDVNAPLDIGKDHSKVQVVSNYNPTITLSIIESMTIKGI